jgi:hypothetical protein
MWREGGEGGEGGERWEKWREAGIYLSAMAPSIVDLPLPFAPIRPYLN